MTKKRVAVALSGGMDSSVAALLLKEAGHEVIGIHMHPCDSSRSEYQAHQAERVCHTLNIPFYVVDLQKDFERYVVDYFCREYKRGRTPNPCIVCNQQIKFGFLLSQALSLGADFLATGHYAQIEHSEDGYHLLKAADLTKDQSYFLYTLTQEKLRHLLFPLGSYTKTEAKQIAKREGLSIAFKPSQDICFISQKNYRAFLSQRFPSVPGDIVDTQGTILGQHQGIAFYTIGQRHGLGLASGKPLYIIRIEPEHNRIMLGDKRELYSQKVSAQKLNWVAGDLPTEPITITAKIRYKSKEAEAILFPTRHCEQGEAISDIWFPQPQKAVTPGQAIVFYQGNEILGGGIIESSQPITLDSERREYVTATKP
jgi:tRNA-specific 2-thiouridylase